MDRMWMKFAARGLVVFWAAFWAWFVVVDVASEPSAVAFRVMTVVLASLAAIVALVWRWPAIGGWTALIAGLALFGLVALRYVNGTPSARLLLVLILALPPIVVGALSIGGLPLRERMGGAGHGLAS